MTVALIEPVTLTNVRTAAPELGPLVPTFDPYAYQRPHPCAVVDPRSSLRMAWDDLAVRWLGYTGAAGWGGVLLYWTAVGSHGAHWLMLLAVPPCAVAWWQNDRIVAARRARHRARRGL